MSIVSRVQLIYRNLHANAQMETALESNDLASVAQTSVGKSTLPALRLTTRSDLKGSTL